MRLSLLILCLLSHPVLALTLDMPLADAGHEARAKALFQEFRCVVCQTESIADSPAEVARDMRADIRRQVSSGASNNEIKAYLTTRYGSSVLMRPPFSSSTLLLWFSPLLLLAAGAALTWRIFAAPKKTS